jgi:hypothetical protein
MKKSHIIIIIALVILIALYLVVRNARPVEKNKRFFKADSAQVYRMEFFNPEDTIVVEKIDNIWKLTYPVKWDVSDEQLSLFFSQVLPITSSTTPMSEDTKMFNLYKVDEESAVQVKLLDKYGKKLDHAYIGNGGNTSFDYGRKNGEWKTYQFKNNITNIVKPDIFTWRSPNITNLKRDQMAKIDVTYLKNAYILTVYPDSIMYTDKRETFTIPVYNRAQHKVINALENLRTWQYIDKGTEAYAERFKKPDCTITVQLKNGSKKTFTLLRREIPLADASSGGPQNDVEVLMMIDGKITPLYQMTGDFINRFTRAAMHFKAEYD